jgi:hypothetical protein
MNSTPYNIYISLPTTYCIEVNDGLPEQAEELRTRIMTTWMLYMVETKFLTRSLLERQVLVDTFLQSFDDDFSGKDID